MGILNPATNVSLSTQLNWFKRFWLHDFRVVDLVRKAVPLALLPEDDPIKEELAKVQEQRDGNPQASAWTGACCCSSRALLSPDILGILLGRDGEDCILQCHFKRPNLSRSAQEALPLKAKEAY